MCRKRAGEACIALLCCFAGAALAAAAKGDGRFREAEAEAETEAHDGLAPRTDLRGIRNEGLNMVVLV